jgi:6-methylsalicylate decarboxylase
MNAATAGNPRRIDVHHHHTSPGFCALIRALNTGQKHHEDWQPADSIATMDEGGVATAVTSTTEPGVWAGDDQAAWDLARESNDYQADLVVNYPGRFGMFTTLPMPNIEGTLREIEYGFDVLKADGVCFMTSYLGKYLGDPTFAPVMEELDRRHAVAYVHPTRTKITNLVPDLIDAILEYGTETSRTIASLMFSGTAVRFPNIRFIFSHGGGTLPFLMGRIMFWAERRQDLRSRLPDGPVAQVRKFFFDTAQAYNPYALASVTRLMPASQIVFGTDFPVITPAVTARGLIDFGFSEAELRLIDRDNALRLMPRLNW